MLLVAFLAIISTAPAYAEGVRGGGGHGGGEIAYKHETAEGSMNMTRTCSDPRCGR